MNSQLEKPWEGDPPYHPDAINDICLSEQFFNELIEQLTLENEEIVELIKKHENIHRSFVSALISKEERDDAAKKLLADYRHKHDRWVHQEAEYNLFYKKVNSGYWPI